MAHILIVDDQESNINLIGMLLDHADISYSWTIDPANIENKLQEIGQVDAVFLDLEFPNADGIEMFPYVKSLPGLDEVPIVAYSVHISEIDRVRQAGFDGFLGKPIDAYEFIAHVQNILQGQTIWEI